MEVEVAVVVPPGVKLSEASVCRIEIRDVSFADAPSKTLSMHEVRGSSIAGDAITACVKVPDGAPRELNVWVRLSPTGAPLTTRGDYVTTRAYPVGPSTGRVVVQLERVGR
jgi:hypothetical protein